MGGKTGTTKSSVSIPPEVLARYNAVNAYAGDVAKTPFQAYEGQFVAGLTPTQQAGIQATSQYSQAAQPYYNAATQQLYGAQQSAMPGIAAAYQNVGGAQDIGSQYAQAATGGIGAALQYAQPYQAGATQAAMAGAQQLTPENINIQGYMSPYTQAVADTTYQALRQQQQQEMAGQTANAIRSGAFGGDRSGLVAANLARQQQLGTAQAMAPIYQQGYQQALGTAMTAAQSNRAALQNLAQQLQGIGQAGYGQQMGAAQQLAGLGQQQYGQGMGAAQQLAGLAQQGYGMGAATSQALAGLGTGAQQAALQGAQAQLGAGTLEQQTQQADLTAQYQQFLQERGYPFQVAQFLANIAMGTGALSGQTTTTTQPMPFFSDRRVKHDVKEIGETHDGQPIYSFKYNGDNATQIGLMAQDVEKKHPDAVGEYGGVKTVDYKRATEDAERKERYEGGLVPASMGGAVTQPGAYGRGGYYDGGSVDPNDIQALLAQQQQAFSPFGEGGIYGASQHEAPFSGAKGIVPQARLHVPKMMQAPRAPDLPESGVKQALSAFDTAVGMKNRYETGKEALKGLFGGESETEASPPKPNEDSKAGVVPDAPKSTPPVSSVSAKEMEEPGILDRLKDIFSTNIYDVIGRANGGAIPRHGYAVRGAVNPYDKSNEYFPEDILEVEPPELKKPDTQSSGSGSGSGLGTALSLAKFALGFFNEGGVVPRSGYQEGGSPDLDRYLNAIAQIESSGNYEALGPRTKTGDRAYGKYQVMGANIPSWTEEAVGKRMSPTEFLSNKEAQDITARHHFGKALNKYGTPEDAASVWFSGRPMREAGSSKDILGTTVPAYIDKFRAAADLPAKGAVAAQGVSPQGSQPSQGVMPGVQNWLAENQSWLTPLGAGLRGMVQSRSPFLAGALLEGAGTGLEAVGAAQKQAADTALVRAQEVAALSRLPKDAVLIDENGRPYGVRVYINGKMTTIPFGKFMEALQQNKSFDLAPPPFAAPQIEAPDLGVEPPPSPSGGAGEPPTAPATTETGQQKEVQKQAAVPIYGRGSASPEVKDIALKAGQRVRDSGIKILEREPAANPFGSQEKIAADANRDTLQRNTLAASLGDLPRSGSFLASGIFGAEYGKPFVDYVNNVLRTVNAGFSIADPSDLANAETAQKISTLLASRRTSEAGQRANAAFETILQAVPSYYNSPEGQSKLLADLYQSQQREIDLHRFYQNVRQNAEKEIPGFTAVESQFMGQGLADEFAARMEQQYAKEKEDLQKLYMIPLEIVDEKTGKVTETYVLPYLAKMAGKISDEDKTTIIQKYNVSPDIFRYFSAQ